MDPKPLKEWNFAKSKLQESGEIEHSTTDGRKLDFDPHHPTQWKFIICHSLEQLKLLKTLFPNTGMGHLWNIPDESPEFESEVEVESTKDPREKATKALNCTRVNNFIIILKAHLLNKFMNFFRYTS